MLDHFLSERVFCAGRQILLEKAETYFETSATITQESSISEYCVLSLYWAAQFIRASAASVFMYVTDTSAVQSINELEVSISVTNISSSIAMFPRSHPKAK